MPQLLPTEGRDKTIERLSEIQKLLKITEHQPKLSQFLTTELADRLANQAKALGVNEISGLFTLLPTIATRKLPELGSPDLLSRGGKATMRL